MTSRILLVRHGRSAHVHDGSWMYADGVRHFESAYNAAGILAHDGPPETLMREASEAHIIASSDLARALASAHRLAPGREPAVTPLLREIELEPPRWIPLRLPIAVWDALSHVQWSYRLLLGSEHEYVRRADNAVAWLMERTQNSETIVAVTHGGFRRIIADRLTARGWASASARRSYANWSVWSFAPTG